MTENGGIQSSQILTVQNVKHFVKNIKEKSVLKEILLNEKRSAKESEFLLEKIKRMKFFESFITSVFSGNYTEVLINFCKKLRYEAVNAGAIIMMQGEESNDNMYIILSGSVNVYKQELGMNIYSKPELIRKQSKISDYMIQERYGMFLRTMGKEEGFGEKALLEEGVSSKRTATIIAKTDCEFIVINKKDFLKVRENYVKILEDKKEKILSGFPVLKTKVFSSVILENFLFCFENVTVHKGDYLKKEGQQGSEKLYLITEGEFLVQKEVKQHDVKQVLFAMEGFQREKTVEQINCKPAKLSHLSTGSLIGEEVIFEREGYQDSYTVVCSSPEGKLLSLSKEVILKKFPMFFINFIKNKHKQRVQQRKEALEKYIFKMLKSSELLSLMKIVPKKHQNLVRLVADPISFEAESILERRSNRNVAEGTSILDQSQSPNRNLAETAEDVGDKEASRQEDSPSPSRRVRQPLELNSRSKEEIMNSPRRRSRFNITDRGFEKQLKSNFPSNEQNAKKDSLTSRWSPKARKKDEYIRNPSSGILPHLYDFERVGELRDLCLRLNKNNHAVLEARSKIQTKSKHEFTAENIPYFLDSKVFDFSGIQGVRQQKYFKSKLYEYGLLKSPLDKANPIPRLVKKKSEKHRKSMLLNKLNYKPVALTETSLESLDMNSLANCYCPADQPNNLLNSYSLMIFSDQEFDRSGCTSNLPTFRSSQRTKFSSPNIFTTHDSTYYSSSNLNDSKLPQKKKKNI